VDGADCLATSRIIASPGRTVDPERV